MEETEELKPLKYNAGYEQTKELLSYNKIFSRTLAGDNVNNLTSEACRRLIMECER